jgi:serine/threonine protein kinase
MVPYPPWVPSVGEVLAERYRIEGVLGAGGMASVYRATDLRLDREVAVKVLLPNIAQDAALAQRFDGEARMLAVISHPNVAAVFDVEPGDPESGREPFYVMELCEGGSLADRIEAGGAMDPTEVVPTIVAVAEGLAELHRRGLIHRDVKPGNILFAGGRPKLADFGLARSDGSTDMSTLTAPGMTVGTPAYLAPELLAGGVPSVASDVYALGATTFHALTGQPPKAAETVSEIVAARSTPAPAVSGAGASLGYMFDRPVAAALRQSPAGRPAPTAFAGELARALSAWQAGASDWAAEDALAETSVAIPVADAVAEPGPQAAAIAAAAPLPSPTTIPPAPIAPSPSPITPPPSRAERPDHVRGRWSLGPVAGLLVLAIAIALLATGRLASLGTIPAASPGASTPSISPGAATTADVAAPALSALEAVRSAIDGAQGGKDGLKGVDANELRGIAADVGVGLRAGDFAAARARAATLADRIDKLDKELDKERANVLREAASKLLSAIPAG